MSNKTVIQINNLEALERLIGGDSEVEIEIRNNIVQNFAKKHLKNISNKWNEEFNSQWVQWKGEIDNSINEALIEKGIINRRSHSLYQLTLGEEFEDDICNSIEAKLKSKFDSEVLDKVTEVIEKELPEMIKRHFDWYISKHMVDRLDERFKVLKNEIIKKFNVIGTENLKDYEEKS